jgi:hypothetical protein
MTAHVLHTSAIYHASSGGAPSVNPDQNHRMISRLKYFIPELSP